MGRDLLSKPHDHQLNQSLATSGLRSTRQRHHVYNLLLQKRDHPTAEEIFMRAKQGMPDISLATVYNCLDTLVQCELVREVNLDRAPTRYCPNMGEHCHFYCEICGSVLDVDLPTKKNIVEIQVPKNYQVAAYEISLRGLCPDCAKKQH